MYFKIENIRNIPFRMIINTKNQKTKNKKTQKYKLPFRKSKKIYYTYLKNTKKKKLQKTKIQNTFRKSKKYL